MKIEEFCKQVKNHTYVKDGFHNTTKDKSGKLIERRFSVPDVVLAS